MSNNPYSKHNSYSPYTTPTYYSRSRNYHQQQQQQPPKKIHVNPNFTSASSTATSGALNNDSEPPINVNVSNPASSSTSRVIVNPKVNLSTKKNHKRREYKKYDFLRFSSNQVPTLSPVPRPRLADSLARCISTPSLPTAPFPPFHPRNP